MREIKFRVWDVKRKKYDIIDYMYWVGKNEIEIDYSENGYKEPFVAREDAAIIEQYTGFKDVNGKEIYEGDMVEMITEINGDYIKSFDDNCIVEWKGAGFTYIPLKSLYCNLSMITNDSTNVKIIGNIHETPELLKYQPR